MSRNESGDIKNACGEVLKFEGVKETRRFHDEEV